MSSSILLERSVLKLGDPIRGEVRGESPINARLFVILSSLLFPGAGSVAKTFTLHREDYVLKPGYFEITYPKGLPPSVSGRANRVRWSLLFGKPRMGGRFFYPRKEVRLKIFPERPERRKESWIEFDKDYYRSDEVVRALLKGPLDISKTLVELEAEEWLSYKGERREVRYHLSDGVVRSENGRLLAEVMLPHDPTTVQEVTFFFPYTFSF
ncbi:MAG: hypothetical protein NZ992_05925, partial [Candidatus Korarchaeum sp.]|nr:hypothetical protein [Candidatus Korarchaeum sp.]MDW8035606.1 hypothetical protein [Candidatus Korarchaeum sp.]